MGFRNQTDLLRTLPKNLNQINIQLNLINGDIARGILQDWFYVAMNIQTNEMELFQNDFFYVLIQQTMQDHKA